MNSNLSALSTNGKGLSLSETLVTFGFVSSIEESKKLIRSGKVFVNKDKIKDVLFVIKGSVGIEIKKNSALSFHRRIVIT